MKIKLKSWLELEISIRHFWIGIYWEVWKDPYRLDLWINLIPFVSFHFIEV